MESCAGFCSQCGYELRYSATKEADNTILNALIRMYTLVESSSILTIQRL